MVFDTVLIFGHTKEICMIYKMIVITERPLNPEHLGEFHKEFKPLSNSDNLMLASPHGKGSEYLATTTLMTLLR